MLIGTLDVRRLFERLGLDALEDPIFDGDRGMVEHLAHEIGHALTLGLEVRRGVSRAVALTLDGFSKTYQIHNEALVLASEMVALPRLGVHFEEDTPGLTMRDAAEDQGVPDLVFWRAIRSRVARELGIRVLRYIGRRAGAGRRS